MAVTDVPEDERDSGRRTPSNAAGRPAQDAKSPGQDLEGSAQDANGPAQDANGPAQDANGPAQDINPLQRLIRQRLEEQGWSYGDVARRGGLPRSTVYTLATTRNLARPPRPATLNGLAWGLDLPVSVVRSAAAESTGLHYYDDEPAGPRPASDPARDVLIASIDELTAEDRQHVAALVESLRKKAAADRPDR